MAVSATHRAAFSIVMLALILSGCASSTSGQLRLIDTKGQVQLLRNAAAMRVPEELIADILVQQDESTRCRTAETDPDGTLRSWRSTVRFLLWAEDDIDPQAVIDDLADSFVDDGWQKGTFGVASIIELTRNASPTVIHLSLKPANDEAREGSEVQISVSGTCVMTPGSTSDEVTMLGSVGD